MKRILLLLCLSCYLLSAIAQEEKIFQYDHILSSDAFGDERKVTVYLPPSYYDYPEDKYTVTYLLDGQSKPFSNLGVKTIEYGAYNYKYTPTIVVGIHAKNRGWEFSMPDPEEENKYGSAIELRKHFKEEIFPFIDSLYPRTLPFKTIIGHSAGGEFVLSTLFSKDRDLFDTYIGISPALRPGENTILEDAAELLQKGEVFSKFLFCSSGTVGEREELFGGAIARLDSILSVYPKHGLIWRKAKFEGMGHWTCVSPSFNEAMVELTRAFRVDEKTAYDFAENKDQSMGEQINAFYKHVETTYGFKEIPLAGYLHTIAIELIHVRKNNKAALELYNWGIEQHPKHYTIRKGKAKLLQKMGQNKEAHAVYLEAKTNLEDIGKKAGEEWYLSQLEYLDKKLKETSD